MGDRGVIWPAMGMALVIFGVWFIRQVQRFAQIRRTPPTSEDLANREAGLRYFKSAEKASNNLINLFEMPVLFFALIPLLIVERQASIAQAVLAWLFVAARLAHSVLHLRSERVGPRFTTYLVSCAILLAMWIGFGIDLAVTR